MKPLGGVRILDFTNHAAGPFFTHMLSQLGAECIKVESAMRPDIFRKPHPVYGRAGAATFDQVASNKLSVRLNLKRAEGIEIAKRLAMISDLAAESFRPGVMRRLGLDYEDLRRARSDIVMVSVSSSGQSGPDSSFAGYAPLFGAWGGLGYLTGYPDGPPVEIRHVMDHSVGMNAALAAVAAIHHRRRTGDGQHVDVSAREVATSLAGDAFLQAAASRPTGRIGNEHASAAPHNAYETRDNDRWIAIAVTSEEQWEAFAEVMSDQRLLSDPRFRTAEDRHTNRYELDDVISRWTREADGEELVAQLQAAGVPAHMSWSMNDIASDEHLRERGTLIEVETPSGERRLAVRAPMRFSKAPEIGPDRGTPELGEHEDYVYGDLLGLSSQDRARLVEEQVIF